MALSDCSKCWETPCECGHNWKSRSLNYLINHREMIDRIIKEKQLGVEIIEECKHVTMVVVVVSA